MLEANLITAVSRLPAAAVSGQFQRHTAPMISELAGSASGGRWGAPNAFSVLYLGRPNASVVVEAYRHLVDDDYDNDRVLTGEMVGPRNLVTCQVDVTDLLDLRDAETQRAVGLDEPALRSAIDEYAPCQRVAHAAHQLGMHGIVAPAATRLGETLALFEENLPSAQVPQICADTERWAHLPPDPRRLRGLPASGHGA